LSVGRGSLFGSPQLGGGAPAHGDLAAHVAAVQRERAGDDTHRQLLLRLRLRLSAATVAGPTPVPCKCARTRTHARTHAHACIHIHACTQLLSTRHHARARSIASHS
jgi:hypothetical protein